MQVTETWLPVKGWLGLYEVSSLGRIKSLPRFIRTNKDKKYLSKEKIMKPSKINSGYLIVTLSYDGYSERKLVHVLVAEAFLDNPNRYGFVNHDDGDKGNNASTNLQWCTRSMNMKHAFENGLIAKRRKRRLAVA